MQVNPTTLDQIYEDIVNSVGYKTTVGPVDKSKVSRRRAGEATKLPSARLARAAWRTAALLAPLTPPPPPPPPPQVAPRTYNKVASADARFCVAGLPKNTRGLYFDAFSSYDENGLDVDGGRTGDKQVAGLKPANEMDGRGPCDPYGEFPPWPAGSYER